MFRSLAMVPVVLAGTGLPQMDAQAVAPLDDLRNAVSERLAAMPDVARHKWNDGTAVEDPAREKVVVDAAIAEGRALGLPPEAVRLAVKAQIEAAKIIQSALIGTWQAEKAGKFQDVPDLGVLRSRIQRSTSEIVQGLAASAADLRQCQAVREMQSLPQSLEAFPEAWNVAVEGIVAAGEGPAMASCAPQPPAAKPTP